LHEGYGLNSGDFKALAAADILAGHHVILANHIGLCFGELGAVTFVSMPGQLILFAPDEPAELVLISFAAVWTGQHVVPLLCLLVEKVTFFHFRGTFDRRRKYFILDFPLGVLP